VDGSWGAGYATALFERATIERYLGYFRKLLEGMIADDRQTVDRIPVLEEAERRKVLYEWNATEAEYRGTSAFRSCWKPGGKTPERDGGGV